MSTYLTLLLLGLVGTSWAQGTSYVMLSVSVNGKDMDAAIQAVKAGTANGGGTVLDFYRVTSENKFHAVLSGGWEEAVAELNKGRFAGAHISSTVVRRMETFARDVLGLTLPPELENEIPVDFTGLEVVKLDIAMGFGDLSMDEFKALLAAVIGPNMALKAQGLSNWHAYKVNTQQTLIYFIGLPDITALDDSIYINPLTINLRDSMHVTTTFIKEA